MLKYDAQINKNKILTGYSNMYSTQSGGENERIILDEDRNDQIFSCLPHPKMPGVT